MAARPWCFSSADNWWERSSNGNNSNNFCNVNSNGNANNNNASNSNGVALSGYISSNQASSESEGTVSDSGCRGIVTLGFGSKRVPSVTSGLRLVTTG